MPGGILIVYSIGTLVYIKNREYTSYRKRSGTGLLKLIRRAIRQGRPQMTLDITIKNERDGGEPLDAQDLSTICNVIEGSHSETRKFVFDTDAAVGDNCAVTNAQVKQMLEALSKNLKCIQITGFVGLKLIAGTLCHFEQLQCIQLKGICHGVPPQEGVSQADLGDLAKAVQKQRPWLRVFVFVGVPFDIPRPDFTELLTVLAGSLCLQHVQVLQGGPHDIDPG